MKYYIIMLIIIDVKTTRDRTTILEIQYNDVSTDMQ